MKKYEVIIVGGGLAGLTAAIHLSQENHSVLVIEKKRYPHHKVCGEYVSNEVLPYINRLGVVFDSAPVQIDTLHLSTVGGRHVKCKLPLGGFGISRYAFDNILYHKALESGAGFRFENVMAIEFKDNLFEVSTDAGERFTAKVVIGAYGKRSTLDKHLNRDFIRQKSSWLGVKAHYDHVDFPDNEVALHNFQGGYGGLSRTESGAVNFCYLASYASFQKERNIARFNAKVVARNPFLKKFLHKAEPIFDEPMSIAQISFQQKKSVANHILMCGDAAGLIHPLCGNGMAMAIHSAKIASEGIIAYLRGKKRNLAHLESTYQKEWDSAFKKRLWTGRQLQSVLLNERLSAIAIRAAVWSPTFLRRLIKNTHGKEIK